MCILNVQLPEASSLQRTDKVCRKIEAILKVTPGVRYATTIVGFSLLSTVSTTYNAFFFVTFDALGRTQEARRTASCRFSRM